MKKMLRDAWRRDSRGFLTILFLNIAVSLTGGISVVMLIPMLGLLDISQASSSALAALAAPLQRFPYAAQVCLLVGMYFGLVVFRAALSRILALTEMGLIEA